MVSGFAEIGARFEEQASLFAGIAAAGAGALLLAPGTSSWIAIMVGGIAYGLSVLELDLPKTVGGKSSRSENQRLALFCAWASIASGVLLQSFINGMVRLRLDWLLFGLVWAFLVIASGHYYEDKSGYSRYIETLEEEGEKRYSRSAKAAAMFSMALGFGLGDFLVWWGILTGGTVAGLSLLNPFTGKRGLRTFLAKVRGYALGLENRLWEEVREAGGYPGSIYPLLVASITLFYMAFFLPFTNVRQPEISGLALTGLLIVVVVNALVVLILDLRHWSWTFIPAVSVFGAIFFLSLEAGDRFPYTGALRDGIISRFNSDLSGAESFASSVAEGTTVIFALYFLLALVSTLPLHKMDVADWNNDLDSKLRWFRIQHYLSVIKIVILGGSIGWVIVPVVDDFIRVAFPDLYGTPIVSELYAKIGGIILILIVALLAMERTSYRQRREMIRED